MSGRALPSRRMERRFLERWTHYPASKSLTVNDPFPRLREERRKAGSARGDGSHFGVPGMEWLNLHASTLDSEQFVRADPVARATWLCLLRYCIGQENGGRIVGAEFWSDRDWLQVAKVTKSEACSESPLWRWEGHDIVVWSYPSEKESIVQRKRVASSSNGSKGGRPKTQRKPSENPDKTQKEPSAKAEGNGREGNGMERFALAWESFIRHLTSKFGEPSSEQLELLMADLKSACPDPEQAATWIENATRNGLRRPCPPLASQKRQIGGHDEHEGAKQRTRLVRALERERKGMASSEQGSKQWATHDAEVKRLEERLEAMAPA